MNILKEKIKRKEKICGTHVHMTDPCICEIFGTLGYDFIWVDMEHTYVSYKDVFNHLNAARAAGTPAVVRVPQHDLTATKKVMEMGPEGVVFPMIRSAEEAKEVISMTLYPPLGNRGFGPMRAVKYGEIPADEYIAEKSLELCRFIQIEHIDAVDHLEEIIEVPHIDGFIFGPCDLSGSLGELGRFFDDKTLSQIKRAIKIMKDHGKYVGLSTGNFDREAIKTWSDLGIDMLSAGADYGYIHAGAKQVLQILHDVHKK